MIVLETYVVKSYGTTLIEKDELFPIFIKRPAKVSYAYRITAQFHHQICWFSLNYSNANKTNIDMHLSINSLNDMIM